MVSWFVTKVSDIRWCPTCVAALLFSTADDYALWESVVCLLRLTDYILSHKSVFPNASLILLVLGVSFKKRK